MCELSTGLWDLSSPLLPSQLESPPFVYSIYWRDVGPTEVVSTVDFTSLGTGPYGCSYNTQQWPHTNQLPTRRYK